MDKKGAPAQELIATLEHAAEASCTSPGVMLLVERKSEVRIRLHAIGARNGDAFGRQFRVVFVHKRLKPEDQTTWRLSSRSRLIWGRYRRTNISERRPEAVWTSLRVDFETRDIGNQVPHTLPDRV